jgi:hypothetical protein
MTCCGIHPVRRNSAPLRRRTVLRPIGSRCKRAGLRRKRRANTEVATPHRLSAPHSIQLLAPISLEPE